METPTQPLVLCVDDEPHVLAGLSLHLRRRFTVLTATSGADGLQALKEHPSVAVVMSDMRMPMMDGATFLHGAREQAPDAVRMLLTGQSDMDSAIAAINKGHIFRFLTKPCPPVVLLLSMQAAVDQHLLITAERVLLEQTLKGVIKTLTDVLALANPVSFSRASRIKATVSRLAEVLGTPEAWQAEVAAMLSQLGYIALGSETAEKVYHGRALSSEEAEAVARVPAITEQLLGNIPRLDVVRAILAGYPRPYRRSGLNESDGPAALVHRAAQLLKVAVDFDAFDPAAGPASAALDIMRGRVDAYDPEVLTALQSLVGPDETHASREVNLSELEVGMVFDEDVRMDGGALLVGRGLEVTAGMVARMRNVRRGAVKEPVRVKVPLAAVMSAA